MRSSITVIKTRYSQILVSSQLGLMNANKFSSRELLKNRIIESINSPYNKYLSNKIKPAIRFKYFRQIRIGSIRSKIGGLPLIGKNQNWPKSSFNKYPLSFVAQIDLEYISKCDLDNELPNTGILSFYFDFVNFDEGKVIYYPSIENLVEAKLPPEFEQEIDRKNLPFWKRIFTKSNNFLVLDEHQLFPSTEFTFPSWDSLEVDLLNIEGKNESRKIEISEEFIDEYCDSSESYHRLLGYYCGLQESKYELNGFEQPKPWKELDTESIKKGLEWRPLLQLDSDREINLNWLDHGKLIFFIKKNDLKNMNFNNIKVIIDTT